MARAHNFFSSVDVYRFFVICVDFFFVLFICIDYMSVSIKSSVQMCKWIFTYICIHVSYHSLRSWDCTQPKLPGLAIESTLATSSSIRWARFAMPTFGFKVKWQSFHTVSLERAQPGTSRVPPPTHGWIIPSAAHTRACVAWHPWAASSHLARWVYIRKIHLLNINFLLITNLI